MVEVDVFWSFGIGASFATAAHRQIKKEVCEWWESPYFLYNVLFAAVIFAPSGIWLLWINCGWETMYLLNKNMPAVIPCVFAATNVTQAILGYYLAQRFIKREKLNLAHYTWIFGWGMTLLILVGGWRRFLYAGTFEDWNGIDTAAVSLGAYLESGLGGAAPWFKYTHLPVKEYPITDFFSSKIFFSLIGMGFFFIPAFAIPVLKWTKAGKELADCESKSAGGAEAAAAAASRDGTA